ncbi:MAG: N-acetylneuraminate synthase family protein [Candidatus Aenigmatarchaeota archaeon]
MIRIADKVIGNGCHVFIIAEIGSNWKISDIDKENFETAKKLISVASEAGVDAVKFQLFKAEKVYVEKAGELDYLNIRKSVLDVLKEIELPESWLPELAEYCKKKNIIFLSTGFDEDSYDIIDKFVPAHKVGSAELTHLPLLKHVASKKKPVIISTGVSDMNEVSEAVDAIRSQGNNDIILMQCTTRYPAPLDSLNLNAIKTMKQEFTVSVGFSDHTTDPVVAPVAAVALGAEVIEKHITLNRKLPGPDQGFALEPQELVRMVEEIRKTENLSIEEKKSLLQSPVCRKILGSSEKLVAKAERELYTFVRRSIYACADISKGDKLSRNNIAVLRSGKSPSGMEPKYFETILGRQTKTAISKGDPITRDTIE